jgi:hypothetical protein
MMILHLWRPLCGPISRRRSAPTRGVAFMPHARLPVCGALHTHTGGGTVMAGSAATPLAVCPPRRMATPQGGDGWATRGSPPWAGALASHCLSSSRRRGHASPGRSRQAMLAPAAPCPASPEAPLGSSAEREERAPKPGKRRGGARGVRGGPKAAAPGTSAAGGPGINACAARGCASRRSMLKRSIGAKASPPASAHSKGQGQSHGGSPRL